MYKQQMGKITAIVPQKRRKDRFSIFIDEEFAMGLGGSVVADAHLKVGQTVDIVSLKEWALEEDYHEARNYLLRLLARKPYTIADSTRKLSLRGYDAPIIARLIQDFTKRRYLNDAEYAELYVKSRMASRPAGLIKIRAELSRKGIAKELIEDVLKDYQSNECQFASALQSLAKKKNFSGEKEGKKRRARIYRFLAQRGYSLEIINQVLHRVMPDNRDVYEE
jgi:regulatory protein